MHHDRTHEAVDSMRRFLRLFTLAQSFGFALLAVNASSVPWHRSEVWFALALLGILTSLMLVIFVTAESLLAWITAVVTAGLLRSWAYAAEGLWAPLGVWWIVVCLACTTAIAYLMLFELESRVGGRRYTDKGRPHESG